MPRGKPADSQYKCGAMALLSDKTKASAKAAGRRFALWLVSSLFILLLSAALISEAFVQKFFDPSIYAASLQKHGLYKEMQSGMADLLSSRMPEGVKENVSALVFNAANEDYFRGQSTRLITNFLGYLSSKNDALDLTLDLSPIKAAFAASPDPTMQALAPEMPDGMDFSAQMRQSGQLERLGEFRSEVSQAQTANLFAIAISVILLALAYAMHPDWNSGAAKCLELMFSAGTSVFIGGAVFAFLSPVGLPMILGVAAASQGAASMIATVMGDVLYEVGLLTMLYSLPLIALGFGLPRILKLNPSQPVPAAAQQPAQAAPSPAQAAPAPPQQKAPAKRAPPQPPIPPAAKAR